MITDTVIRTYKQFEKEVKRLGLTEQEVRFEIPPTQKVLDLLDRTPDYERFVGRMFP